MHSIFKPKTEEEIELIHEQLIKQTDIIMSECFKNLIEMSFSTSLVYFSSYDNAFMFEIDTCERKIYVSYNRVWRCINKNSRINFITTQNLIQNWLKSNTTWPHFIVDWI